MNDWHLYVFAGMPTVTVLLAIWRADRRMDALEKRIDEVRGDVKEARAEAREDLKEAKREIVSRIDRIADTDHELHLVQGRHDARLDALERDKK